MESLYEEERESSTVMNGINGRENNSRREIHDEDMVESLESGVQFWTDFSKVHYHPQSLYELSGLWVDVQEFDNYGIGKDAFSGGKGEEMIDRLRFFVEECDYMQVYFHYLTFYLSVTIFWKLKG